MSDTEQEIRSREEQQPSQGQSTPSTTTDDSGGGGGGGGVGLPFSISRRQFVIVAGLVVVAVVVRSYINRDSTTSAQEELDAAREADEPDDVAEGESGQIKVPNDDEDPLAGDEEVLAALKDRGTMSGGGD